MELRRIRDGEVGASILGLSIDSAHTAFHPPEPTVRRLLQIAQSAGIRILDTADSVHPARTEAMLGRMERFDDGTIWVLERSAPALGLELSYRESTDEAAPLETRLRESLGSLPRRPGLDPWVQWSSRPPHRQWEVRAVSLLGELERAGEIAGWGIRVTDPAGSTKGFAPGALSGELSLLDRRWESSLREDVALPSFLARNPMADGRLDGTRWASPLWPTGRAPAPLRRVQEDLRPVLQLEFLTEGSRRTLAQSAIQYAAGLAGVASILAPLPPPERLSELLGFASTPPLSDDERSRLSHMTELGPANRGPDGF